MLCKQSMNSRQPSATAREMSRQRRGGGEKVSIAGELTAMFLVSLGLLPKAVLEAAYFQDGESAKMTLRLWLWLMSALCLSLLFSFLFYYYG